MTSETKVFIDFNDILGLELECVKCGARYSRPIGNISHFPMHCQSCGIGITGAEWFFGDRDGYRVMLTDFSTKVEQLTAIPQALEQRKLRVRIEIKPSISQKSEREP